jgi:predicted nuclease with TOPRIM domain
MDFKELLDLLFSSETFPEDARQQLEENFTFHSDLANEKILGLETANGEANANLARIEGEHADLTAKLAAATDELAFVKSGKLDELLAGGTNADANADEGIAADPDEVVDLTADELVNKYTN